MSNIIRAIFNNVNDKEVFAKARYQYDYGMILRFEGAVTLPSAFEVHFALEKHGEAITQIGDPEGVPIPDALFLAGKTIYAWAYLHSGEDDGYTEYMVQIPVIKRAQPSDEVPTPVQQSAIDQAIAALGVAVEQTAADVETTTANAESAQASEEAAAASAAEAAETAENVEENVTAARAAKADAEAARDRAVQAETSANQSKTAAASSETNAAASATAASASAAAALTSEENANGAMMSAYSDANRADTAADTATSAKSDAVSAKTAAQSAKTAAETAASTATTKASEAAASATTASTAASTATTKAGEAATSATNAAASAQSVASSAAQITQNTEDIDALKEDLVNLSSGKQTISGVFSYGVFNSSNMPEADPRKFNAVMMTAETYGRDITLTSKDGYNFLAYFYDANDNYVSKSTRWETSRYVPKNTYFRLWVRPDPLDTSIVLDLDAVKQQILFNVPIQDEIDDTVKSVALANANADLSGAGLQMIDTSFAYGTMNTQTGQAVSDTAYKYQVIMPAYATYDRDVTIKCNSGYRYQVWWYNEDDTYISRTASFRTDADEYTITAGTHFRLFVALNPQNISANVPIETFAENIFIRTKINDRVTAVETKPLSTLPEYILNTLSYKQVGVLSKGYILLSCDDGTEGLATYTIPMLINKGVPATFGLLMTSPVITNESYLSTVLDAVNNHGCCVAQHGSAQWTTYAEDTLNKYFDDTEALFTEKGITEIHGAICPGGAVADTNALVQAVAGGRFKSLFSGGLQGEIKYGSYNAVGARTNMYAMARYSAIAFTQQTCQQAIDDAYDNHYILCPFWHDYSVVDDTAKQAIIEGMIDYAKTKGLTFITMADLPNII